MFTPKIVTFLSLLASGALAADVFATFSTSEGAISPNFDVANTRCFTAANAIQVSFSQSGGIDGTTQIDGPYCLLAFSASGCPGSPGATQQFETLVQATEYPLNSGIASTGSYIWQPFAC